jgi:hypothetical protein
MLQLDNAAGSQVLSPILLKKELIGHILNLGGHLLFDGRKEVSPISSGPRSHLVLDFILSPISAFRRAKRVVPYLILDKAAGRQVS